MIDAKYTTDDLKIMQNWSLNRKIQVTQTRIIEYCKHFDNKIFVLLTRESRYDNPVSV